jgi:hypothetical protein
MFPSGSDACKSVNWKHAQTILRGGVNYQHPHSDTAKVNSYAGLDIFPFVCIHAFGQEAFSMWLGPGLPTRSYGILHKFDAKNMLFMRGDFVHAGAVGTTPRAHMEFSPLECCGQVSAYILMATPFVSVWLPLCNQSRSQEWEYACVLSS